MKTFKPTDPKVMEATIGRPYTKPNLNPPQYEDAVKPIHNPNLFWMGLVNAGKERFIK